MTTKATAIDRAQLAALLNEDLSREYQAIIAYVIYSQALKGAKYMPIADQLQTHAAEELKHALTIARQISSHRYYHLCDGGGHPHARRGQHQYSHTGSQSCDRGRNYKQSAQGHDQFFSVKSVAQGYKQQKP